MDQRGLKAAVVAMGEAIVKTINAAKTRRPQRMTYLQGVRVNEEEFRRALAEDALEVDPHGREPVFLNVRVGVIESGCKSGRHRSTIMANVGADFAREFGATVTIVHDHLH